jgi:hypothetical protein
MASTATNNNSVPSTATNNNSVPSAQPAQFPFTGQQSGPTSQLSSLKNATDPTGFSFNQQQPPVGTFPQRTPGGAPTVYYNSY